jgi:hypothetical protein
MRARYLIPLVVITIGGCRDSPTSPRSNAVEVAISVSRNAKGNPEVSAVVLNGTRQQIERWDGCSYWYGMGLSFSTLGYSALLLFDPSARPLCPDSLVVLPPGGRLEGRAMLTGTLYTWDAERVEMSPGTYYAIVRFDWRESNPPARHALMHAVSFVWPLSERPAGVVFSRRLF